MHIKFHIFPLLRGENENVASSILLTAARGKIDLGVLTVDDLFATPYTNIENRIYKLLHV